MSRRRLWLVRVIGVPPEQPSQDDEDAAGRPDRLNELRAAERAASGISTLWVAMAAGTTLLVWWLGWTLAEAEPWDLAFVPQLDVATVLSAFAVLIVVLGAAVLSERRWESSASEVSLEFADKRVREVALLSGFAAATIGTWGVVGAIIGSGPATAGARTGNVLVAGSCGAVLVMLSSLVRVAPTGALAALTETRRARLALEREQRLTQWNDGVPVTAAWRSGGWSQIASLLAPVALQVVAATTLTVAVAAIVRPEVAGWPFTIGVNTVSAVCFLYFVATAVGGWVAIPRSLFVSLLALPILVPLVLVPAVTIRAASSLWQGLILVSPWLFLGVRLGGSLIVRRGPWVRRGVGSLLDRRWIVFGFLGSMPRLAAEPVLDTVVPATVSLECDEADALVAGPTLRLGTGVVWLKRRP